MILQSSRTLMPASGRVFPLTFSAEGNGTGGVVVSTLSNGHGGSFSLL